jgi:Iron-containing redox enzyme
MEAIAMMHARTETEPIFRLLDTYRAELLRHPLLQAARCGEVPTEILKEFAFHQFSDSILWIPMLAQMRSKATRSRRLRRAIADNIACEAGLHGTSHVTLAVTMLRSLGVTSIESFANRAFAISANEWLSEEFAAFAEPEISGWLLVAEALVPVLFAGMKPCFDQLACDTTYFREHISVDHDEHAVWMAESIADVYAIYGPPSVPRIVAGMDDAWRETLKAPDELWAHRLQTLERV